MDRPIIRLNGGQLRLSFLLSAPPFGGACAQVAQLVEHSTENAGVGCSNQPLGTISFSDKLIVKPDRPRAVARHCIGLGKGEAYG